VLSLGSSHLLEGTFSISVSLNCILKVMFLMLEHTKRKFYLLNVLLIVHHSVSELYSETNAMQFLFSLLRLKGLYMFQALIAHPQEVLNKWHLVYYVFVISVGCTRIEVKLCSTSIPVQPTDRTRMQHTKCHLYSAS
jgi:hypothetical protein